MTQPAPVYLRIGDEVYKLIAPTFSVHNLIVGTPYIDIGGMVHVIKLVRGEPDIKFETQFFNRGWFNKD